MMYAIKLTFATLCMVTLTYAAIEYELRCTSSEIGIRWPSYTSNSQYYVCQREGGKVMTISCNPGEVFTFVLQSCTPYSKYIPAPPMNALPTSSTPIVEHKPDKVFIIRPEIGSANVGGSDSNSFLKPNNLPSTLPKPNYPDNSFKPPTLLGLVPPSNNNAIPSPPIENMPPITGLGSNINLNNIFSNNIQNITQNKTNDIPPMPATPAPTPPVVALPNESEKKQPEILNKQTTVNNDKKTSLTKLNKNGSKNVNEHKAADKKSATNKNNTGSGKNDTTPKKVEKTKPTTDKKAKKGGKNTKPEKTNIKKVAKNSAKGAPKTKKATDGKKAAKSS